MSVRRIVLISTCLTSGIFSCLPTVSAQDSTAIDANHMERLRLARDFVSKMKKGKVRADKILGINSEQNAENILPEGEILLLQPTFKRRLKVDGVVSTLVHNKKMLFSLTDLAIALRLPINVRDDLGTAEGWYIREEKKFSLDTNKKLVVTDHGTFNTSENVLVQDGDIWVPTGELGSWLGTEFDIRIASQEVDIKSKETYPLEAKLNRKRGGTRTHKTPPPVLPIGSEEYQLADVPVIDVSTNTSYQKRGSNDEGTTNYSANISAVNDFAYGTLRTRANLNKRDKLSSVRVSYKQESIDGDLLGPLNARRFEVGDIISTRVPFANSVSQELGVRVSNTDLVRRTVVPSTGISGTGTPGWDVELYRENQFLGVQTIGEDGLYQFSNINLFVDDNNFRLVFYGPQGEIHEEDLYVPVDQTLLSRGKGVYDFSVTLNDKSTYVKNPIDDDQTGEPNIFALYEKPFSNGVTVTLGASSRILSTDERETQGSVNISAPVGQTLLGAGASVNDNSDIVSELSLRRNFGQHEAIYSAGASLLNDDGEDGSSTALTNNVALQGPLPFGEQRNMRYNLNADYTSNSENDDFYSINGGINGAINRLTYGGQLEYNSDDGTGQEELSSFVNLSGGYGRNFLRLTANYDITPESELQTINANYQRDVNNKLNFQLNLQKNVPESLTSYAAQLDWQAGFIRLSPRISYNSNQDFTATLSTRFGLLKDPYEKKWKMSDRSFSSVGTLSAFVYLDKDGNGEFDGEDEPLSDVTVLAPQNGRQKRTDENGIAFFDRMARLLRTDVYVDNDTLQDPTWISSFEGISVIPREGYVAEVEFPVHRAGEIDGLVVVKNQNEDDEGSAKTSIRSVAVHLINQDGEIEKTAYTDDVGFYYISQIPPGRYFLIIDSESAQRRDIIRPMPQRIEIGYDGTILFGNNIEVELGEDVPSEFLSNIEDYKSLHPDVDFSNKDYDLVLNLGEFNSRLLTSVVWYKVKSRFGSILRDAELFVSPKDSNPDTKTGKHAIRVGLPDTALEQAYSRCKALMVRGQECKVEIYPSFIKQADLGDITPAAGEKETSEAN